jgi:hypothetical protein
MDKRQLIDDIRLLNTTASPKFLAQFDPAALRQYLDHLNEARTQHLRPHPLLRRKAAERVLV